MLAERPGYPVRQPHGRPFATVVEQTCHEKIGLSGGGVAQVRNDIQAVAPVARRHRIE